MLKIVTCVAAFLGTTVAADALEFSMMTTKSCLTSHQDDLGLQLSCIGRSADLCMVNSVGGESTVGMGGCLNLELQYWDQRLNDAYARARTQMQAHDAEMDALDSSATRQWPALQAMQRAWIPFRDATCDLERSFWGGGTGGGPATLSCLMIETGEQALRLERLADRAN